MTSNEQAPPSFSFLQGKPTGEPERAKIEDIFFLTSALFGVESKKHRILFKNAVFHFGWVLKSGFYLCFCVYPKTQCKQWEGICSSY